MWFGILGEYVIFTRKELLAGTTPLIINYLSVGAINDSKPYHNQYGKNDR